MIRHVPSSERVFLIWYIIMLGVGLLFIFGVSRYAGSGFGYSPFLLFFKQLGFAILSLGAMLFFRRVPYQKTRRWVPFLVIFTFLLMLLVFVPKIGLEAGGARRWINLRLFSFNPSELAKLTGVIYLSHIMVKKQEEGDKLANFTFGLLPPLLIIMLMVSIILLQSGFSSAVMLLIAAFAMIFIGGGYVRHLIMLGGLSIPVLAAAVWNVAYRRLRITAYLDPWQDAGGIGYQGIQSLQALANGGFWGTGLGNGLQKIARLPAAHTDFIFSVVVEELGFIGGFCLMVSYAGFFLQGLKLALRISDKYAQLMAFGITTLIASHALVNVMIAMAMLPPTGVSLPFISYGGSSLLVLSVGMGILLNIASQFPENAQPSPRVK